MVQLPCWPCSIGRRACLRSCQQALSCERACAAVRPAVAGQRAEMRTCCGDQ